MLFVKVNAKKQVKQFPMSEKDVRKLLAKQNIGLPTGSLDSVDLTSFGIYPVEYVEPPKPDYEHKVGLDNPTWNGHKFIRKYKKVKFTDEEQAERRIKRLLDVKAERNKRLLSSFKYDFGDKRGVHVISLSSADMTGWDEVDKRASALLALGDEKSTIKIKTETGFVDVTPLEWKLLIIAMTDFRQSIREAYFKIKEMKRLPDNFNSDSYWIKDTK